MLYVFLNRRSTTAKQFFLYSKDFGIPSNEELSIFDYFNQIWNAQNK